MEMIDADLVNDIAGSLVEEFEKFDLDIVATACGQCKRMILNAIKAKKAKVKVMDIVELALEAGIAFEAGDTRPGVKSQMDSPQEIKKEAKYG
jgi:hypothetical protein